MPDPSSEESSSQDSRNRRGPDRRGDDRRRPERRAPPPIWRRPWAFAVYGVLGAFAIVVLSRLLEEDDPTITGEVTTAAVAPAVDTTSLPAANAPAREAMGVGEYERLVAQGEAAAGQRVITQLYCEPMNSISMDSEAPVIESLAALADASNRVPGAACKWGTGVDAPDLLLLVPADLARAFAAAPEVQQSFVSRRSVRAELEWIGRSEALALRNVGVLRAIR
jgi:hypothetical protein